MYIFNVAIKFSIFNLLISLYKFLISVERWAVYNYVQSFFFFFCTKVDFLHIFGNVSFVH